MTLDLCYKVYDKIEPSFDDFSHNKQSIICLESISKGLRKQPSVFFAWNPSLVPKAPTTVLSSEVQSIEKQRQYCPCVPCMCP